MRCTQSASGYVCLAPCTCACVVGPSSCCFLTALGTWNPPSPPTSSSQEALKKRDTVQLNLQLAEESLDSRRMEKHSVERSDGKFSMGSLFGGKTPEEVKAEKQAKLDTQIAELTQHVEGAHDSLEVTNANVTADMDRWRQQKDGDLRKIILSLAEANLAYFTKVCGGEAQQKRKGGTSALSLQYALTYPPPFRLTKKGRTVLERRGEGD